MESERMRLLAGGGREGGGTIATPGAAANVDDDDDDSIDVDDPNESVIACFGEIVEDPTLSAADDGGGGCDDPAAVREKVRALNRDVLDGFLKLVRALADDPNDSRKLRDELSHNLFLMLQECNKFREHQARELLIRTLEVQLKRRREGLALLKEEIRTADLALKALREFGG
ncbi:hypothetical protein ACHAW5_001156 [Stephanodiscus triporus]|uniref:Mediator of RNA polymerase II transcription subunit 7 n=1 Tax=Stephanodiscus triporus TaxID=2934178 RepID=A0ABD3MSQ4_9STRA